jgi:hypothetical protein
LLVVACAGFVIGGAVAGRHRRTPKGAATQGFFAALLPVSAASVADIIRYVVLGHTISIGTVSLWLALEVAALILGAVGGVVGRRVYVRWKKQRAGLA